MSFPWAKIFAEIREHAEGDPHREVCGVVLLDGTVRRFQNIAAEPYNRFTISASMISRHLPNIFGIYHSHIDFPAFPTPLDLADWTLPGRRYIICSVQGGKVVDTRVFVCGTQPVSGHRFAMAEQPQLEDTNAETCR